MSNEREVLTDDLFGTATREQVADTGRMLVHRFCEDHVAGARMVVICEKPPSLIKADHVWRRTERWIDVPWPVLSPVLDPDALAH